MPQLPSGLKLAIARTALFDHGGNWFKCPDGHFWYWVADPELGQPPFADDVDLLTVARHAPVPTDRAEAARYITVLEGREDEKYAWRGEWLHDFPAFTNLSSDDRSAWEDWLAKPETQAFIEETIEECQRLAEVSADAKGYPVYENVGEPDGNGRRRGYLRPTRER